MHIAAIPGMIFAIAISVLIGMATAGGTISSLVIVTIGGGGGLLLYLRHGEAPEDQRGQFHDELASRPARLALNLRTDAAR